MVAARKKDMVRDAILHRLITARHRYGDAIPVKEICEQIGASRQPIMAALASLGADGFIRIVAQVGCEVVRPSERDVADFFRMFARLESLMAELAAERGTPSKVDALAAINARIRTIDPGEPDAGERYRTLNREFHAQIHAAAASPILQGRQATLFAMADFLIGQSIGFVPHLAAAADEHDAIVAALGRCDSAAASAAMAAHIDAVGNAVLAGQRFPPSR